MKLVPVRDSECERWLRGMVVFIERPLCRLRPVFCLCHSGKENGPESHLGSGATLLSIE